jgi:probable rRNA maturation factor
MIDIQFSNEQPYYSVDEQRLIAAVRAILEGERIQSATISLAIVDDPTIHRLNREYLNHDCPTDVLSFVLEQNESHLEGEVVVSADTAVTAAGRFGWSVADELLLYVVHGTLHLVGYDDLQQKPLAEMRVRERHYLASYGLVPRYDDSGANDRAAAGVAKQ